MGLPLVLGPLWVGVVGRTHPFEPVGTVAGLIVVLLLATCTYTDLLWKRIPNWATYSALLWAMVINGTVSLEQSLGVGEGYGSVVLGAVGLLDCLLGAAVCFGVMLLAFRMAGGGAGDVKLGAALGGLLGLHRGLDALIWSYLIAGVVLAGWTIWRVGPVTLLAGLGRRLGALLLPGLIQGPSAEQARLLGRPVPLAAFFAAGTIGALTGGGLL